MDIKYHDEIVMNDLNPEQMKAILKLCRVLFKKNFVVRVATPTEDSVEIQFNGMMEEETVY